VRGVALTVLKSGLFIFSAMAAVVFLLLYLTGYGLQTPASRIVTSFVFSVLAAAGLGLDLAALSWKRALAWSAVLALILTGLLFGGLTLVAPHRGGDSIDFIGPPVMVLIQIGMAMTLRSQARKPPPVED